MVHYNTKHYLRKYIINNLLVKTIRIIYSDISSVSTTAM